MHENNLTENIKTDPQNFNYDETKDIYPIIKVDVEHTLDATNIEFYQDSFVITGLYNDNTADFTTTNLIGEIDYLSISEIINIISFYDIFKGYIEQTINEETDLTSSVNVQNYLIFLK